MIRVVPFLGYLLLLAAHVVITRDVTMIYGVTINLAVLMVLLVALYKSEFVTLWFGFACGIVSAAGSPATVGWQAMLLAGIGMAGYHFRQRINLDSLYSRLLLVTLGVLVHCLLGVLLDDIGSWWYRALTVAVPSTIYTAAVAWLYFLFKDERITLEKVRSIF
ncbi:MAG: hypothetical protein ABIE70_13070 [bacterium]